MKTQNQNGKKDNGTAIKTEEGTPSQENQTGHDSKRVPTPEEIRQWIGRDLKSAIYFLSYIDSLPEVKDLIVGHIHEDAVNGPKLKVQ